MPDLDPDRIARRREQEALRARRHRAHARGVHGLCRPGGPCPDAPPAPDAEAVPVPAAAAVVLAAVPVAQPVAPLQPGEPVTEALVSGLRSALAREGARIVARLDVLNELLEGGRDAWLTLEVDGASVAKVVVSAPLSEARQQATALRGIVAALQQGAAAATPAEESDLLDDLAKARAARQSGTAAQPRP